MNLKLEQGSMKISDESPLGKSSEDADTNLTEYKSLDTELKGNTVKVNAEEVDDSKSSNQHRKTFESIAKGDVEDNAQNENKQTKTLIGNHNSKNRRRKKLRKT